ncbi:MFS transporter [Clostridium bovifaecis]|uniref:MFS transporter n=1 Tax=Clostridium bovifaecis TaxID=2184719 RepID=A0A6I6F0J2_9CLOT|nr:MFS transporter [Clostridium bovifaecis]
MFLSAMYDNVRGPFVPTIKNEFNINNTGIATTLLVCSLGYMISTYVGGILCEKIGQKRVFVLGFILIILSPIGIYFSRNFTIYMMELFLLNMGQAFIGIAINTIVPIIALSFQAIIMNLTHFSYGVGATFTQRFTGIMLYEGITWREIYIIIAIISAITFLGFLFVRLPELHISKDSEKIKYKEIFNNKLIYFYMIALGSYVAAEINTGNWFINFMYSEYGYNENRSSVYTALFFGTFTVGRLLGGFIVEKLGYIKSVLISITIAFILYLAGLIIGEKGIAIISISGLFFAITFPTIVLSISKVFKNNTAYITGLVIAASSFISMMINLLIGAMNDYLGVYQSYYIIPICLLLCMIFTYLIQLNTRKILGCNGRGLDE